MGQRVAGPFRYAISKARVYRPDAFDVDTLSPEDVWRVAKHTHDLISLSECYYFQQPYLSTKKNLKITFTIILVDVVDTMEHARDSCLWTKCHGRE